MCTVFIFTDVFHTGIWANIPKVRDPHLKSLAAMLPSMALQSRQEGTLKNYRYGWDKWKSWAFQYAEVNIIPADPLYIALYLYELSRGARTAAPVNLAFYAISWAHKLAGLEDPTNHTLPKMVREAVPRTLAFYSNKKDPVTVEMISKLVHKYGTYHASLADVRLVAMILLAFAAFLRYQELANLRFSDVVFEPGYIKIFVEQSKTDKYRHGIWIYVANTGNVTCPVRALARYLEKAGRQPHPDMFMFRGITRHKVISRRVLRHKNVPLAYTTARTLILQAMAALGFNPALFGTHSLRAGGATAAANRSMAAGCQINQKHKYVHEDIRQRLLVSKNLGL